MKDPLQTEMTPYEVLQIERGASKADIQAAFKKAIVRRVPVKDATQAQKDLLSPQRRLRHDLVHYDAKAVRGLSPCPLDDADALLPARRAATAAAWEASFKQRLTDTGLAHSLGVLWYWWARYEEDRFLPLLTAAHEAGVAPQGRATKPDLLKQVCTARGLTCDPSNSAACTHADCPYREDCSSPTPSLADMWQHVIGYWSLLDASPHFWDGEWGLPEADIKAVREDFMGGLQHLLLDRAQRYGSCGDQDAAQANLERIPGIGPKTAEALHAAGLNTLRDLVNAGREVLSALPGVGDAKAKSLVDYAIRALDATDALPRQYRTLVLALERERKTAKAVADAGVKMAGGRLCCGVILLRRFGLVDSVRAAAEKTRSRALLDALSRYAPVSMLVDAGKPQEALDLIESLPAKDKKTDEICDLRARALRLLGKQQASLHRYALALDTWGTALKEARDADLRRSLSEDIVNTAASQALALEKSRRDDAIDLLDKAVALVNDTKLRDRLADLLTQRGINNFLEGEKQVDAAVPAYVEPIVREAIRAAGDRNWDRAIEKLREALKTRPPHGQADADPGADAAIARCRQAVADLERAAQLGSKRAREQLDAAKSHAADWGAGWQDRLTQRLSTYLTNRAVDRANRSIEVYNEAARRHQAYIETVAAGGGGAFGGNPELAAMAQRLGIALPPGMGGGCCVPGCHGDPQYTMTTAGGRKCSLCAHHAEEFRTPPRPAEALNLLRGAEADLLEALKLSPASEHARSNLEVVHKALRDVGEAPRRPAAADPKAVAKAAAKAHQKAARQTGTGQPTTSGTGKPSMHAAAVVSLIFGILAIFPLSFIGVLVSVITGHVALAKIRNAPHLYRGRGLAIAGLAMSYFVLAILVIAGLAIILKS